MKYAHDPKAQAIYYRPRGAQMTSELVGADDPCRAAGSVEWEERRKWNVARLMDGLEPATQERAHYRTRNIRYGRKGNRRRAMCEALGLE